MYQLFGFAEKLNIQNYINSTKNILLYMYGLGRFAEKLNIQNCVNFTGNWVYHMYRFSGFVEKLNIHSYVNLMEVVYNRCMDCWICRLIEFLELHKFNGKFCTLYVQNV